MMVLSALLLLGLVFCLPTRVSTESVDVILLSSDTEFMTVYELANSPAVEVSDVENVQSLFRHFRSLGMAPSPAFVKLIGKRLSRFAHLFEKHRDSVHHDPAMLDVWRQSSDKLLQNEKNNAEIFYRYRDREWEPHLFTWADMTIKEIGEFIPLLASDALFVDVWLPALVAGNRYGGQLPRTVSLSLRTGNNQWELHEQVRAERVDHLYDYFVLFKCTGALAQNFKQVVEFGGGTGDNAALLRELRFVGTHFVFDLPEMLLLQQYFLSYSNWPVFSYLERDLLQREGTNDSSYISDVSSVNSTGIGIGDGDAGLKLTAISNVSEVGHIPTNSQSTLLLHNREMLKAKYNTSLADQTLFWATFSLSETPLELRDKVLDRYYDFGTVFLTLQISFLEVDNIDWLRAYAKARKDTHYSCAWLNTHVTELEHYHYIYFISRKQNLGRLKCASEAMCVSDSVFFCNEEEYA